MRAVQTAIRTGAAVQDMVRGRSAQSPIAARYFRIRHRPVPRNGPEPPDHARGVLSQAACCRCQRINRFQQMTANFLAAATRATLTPERLRTRW